MTSYKVGYLVGSLAAASINRLLATALMRLAPRELTFTEISFKELPLANPLADGQVTDSSTAEFLRNYMAEFHAFITRVYTALPREK